MKILMILTSLIVAMSLTACEYRSDTDKKTSYKMEQSSEQIEKSEDMKNEATDDIQPVSPPLSE